MRTPALPAAAVIFTFILVFSGADGAGVDGVGAGAEGVDGGLAGVGGVGTGAGASLTGLGVDSVEGAGAAAVTLSKYHAAAKPSFPCAVRTRTH